MTSPKCRNWASCHDDITGVTSRGVNIKGTDKNDSVVGGAKFGGFIDLLLVAVPYATDDTVPFPRGVVWYELESNNNVGLYSKTRPSVRLKSA